MTRRKRFLLIGAASLAVVALAGWYFQHELRAIGARWYLARIAAREEKTGDLTERRDAVARIHRMLLMPPPPDVYVPELFDLITAVTPRVTTGEIDMAWAAYVYSSYERDMVRDRPNGAPRRSQDQIEAAVVEYVEFYKLQKRPDVAPPSLSGDDGEWLDEDGNPVDSGTSPR